MKPQTKAYEVIREGQYNKDGVIRMLADEKPHLFLKYAAANPASVLDSITGKSETVTRMMTVWDTEQVKQHIRDKRLVDAIKHIRAVAGVGLKEAKLHMDYMREVLNHG